MRLVKSVGKSSAAIFRERTGSNPLAWVLSLAQRPPEKATSADWETARRELAIFARLSSDPYSAGARPGGRHTWIPTEAEAREVCEALPEAIRNIVAHEPLLLIAIRPGAR